MPLNGDSEALLFGMNGVPFFTYGMIGITTLVLAYVTFTDDFEKNSFADPETGPSSNPLSSVIPVAGLAALAGMTSTEGKEEPFEEEEEPFEEEEEEPFEEEEEPFEEEPQQQQQQQQEQQEPQEPVLVKGGKKKHRKTIDISKKTNKKVVKKTRRNR